MIRRSFVTIAYVLALIFLVFGVGEALVQHSEDEYVRSVSQEILRDAPRTDLISKIEALRDHVRTHVRDIDFPLVNRPFFRDSAAETLRMGKGRCGEATRVFINLARAEGIPAQRLYLEGAKSHVVAVVNAEDGNRLIVDSADNPFFSDVEPLSNLPHHTGFTSASAIEWRRLKILRRLPSNELNLGPFVYLLENPHALVACFSFITSTTTLLLALALRRRLPRTHPQTINNEFPSPAPFGDGGIEV